MGDLAAMKRSATICINRESSLIVVSATSGTTNQLLETARLAEQGKEKEALVVALKIKERHLQLAKEAGLIGKGLNQLNELLTELDTLTRGISLMGECSPRAKDRMAALGELMSSLIFTSVLQKLTSQYQVEWFDVRQVMRTDGKFLEARPDTEEIRGLCAKNLSQCGHPEKMFVTQGFIGASEEGHTTTLGRGGSDYSAALLAEGLAASVLEIWTDVPGIATTDPRLCHKAKPIPEITFKEAAELAIFGAKVLHPTTLAPAMRSHVAVFVGNSFAPDGTGTWIKWETKEAPLVRALALRKNQGLVTLSTPKMLNQYGFLSKIFNVFNEYQVSVDAITTSEISVALTVNTSVLENKALIAELNKLGEVKIEPYLTLVSLIGNNINHTAGLAHSIFGALENINVRMICQGASVHNFCFLVDGEHGEEALQRLHRHFLE